MTDAIDQLVEDGDLVREATGSTGPPTWELEQELASADRTMLGEPAGSSSRSVTTRRAPTGGADRMSSWQASERAFAHRLSVITGGPGTGKTATIKTVAATAGKQQAQRCCWSRPTGRAARRMTEASGFEAKTSTRRWAGSRASCRSATRTTRCPATC